jgi:hypothetical protein
MTEINIFEDHVFFDGGWKTEDRRPPIDGFPLSKFADLYRLCRTYSDYLLRTQKIKMKTYTDWEGIPFDEIHEIRFNATDHHTDWSSSATAIWLTCYDTSRDDYDYVAKGTWMAPSRFGGRTKVHGEKRSRISKAAIKRTEGDAEPWFRDELTRLKKILDGLDQATLTLRSWADSGLSMRVSCSTWCCRGNHNPAIISSDQLLLHAIKGLSLDDFKQKLKCKVCGTRCSSVRVP